jgi:predicted transposase YdaD
MNNKPFDTSGKTLLEVAPADWVTFLGFPCRPDQVTVLDANVTMVNKSADKVILVSSDQPWLLHVEFQSDHELRLPRRMLSYNALLQHHHDLPVSTVVLLLRKEANASSLTGSLQVMTPLGLPWEFRYNVLRVWQIPAQQFLQGPTALVPLALIADVKRADLTKTAHDLFTRLQALPERAFADQLLALAFALCGLRYDKMTIQELMYDVEKMKEVTAFNIMHEKGMEKGEVLGELKHARSMLLRLGSRKFGPPNAELQTKIAAISDLPKLEELTELVLSANTWYELFPSS